MRHCSTEWQPSQWNIIRTAAFAPGGRFRVRILNHASIYPLALLLAFTVPGDRVWAAASTQSALRQQLIGSWRLVSIEVSGPAGPLTDPFYQAESVGLIIYDESGWMSVQIAAPHRQGWPPANSRSAQQSARDPRLKAVAFDSYYAYFGTWDLDHAHSVVTHRVTASLIPAETGAIYSQTVAIDGSHMTLTSVEVIKGVRIVRRKLWERS